MIPFTSEAMARDVERSLIYEGEVVTSEEHPAVKTAWEAAIKRSCEEQSA